MARPVHGCPGKMTTLPWRAVSRINSIYLGKPDLAERSMNEIEEFTLFTSKVRLPNSDKKRKLNNLF